MSETKINLQDSLVGFQHVLAMYAGAVAVPLLIGEGLDLSRTEITYLIAIDIFMSGLATLLQLHASKYFGVGLPVVLGSAIQVVAPAILIGKSAGLPTVFGAVILSGLFLFLFSSFFSKVRLLFPPVVTGTVITVIGLTLIPIATAKMGGGDIAMKGFGSFDSLFLAFLTIAIILLIELFGTQFLRSIAVLIGLVGGTLVATFMGKLDLSPFSEAPAFQLPQPFYFGLPKFDFLSTFLMILIVMICTVESTGVYFALSNITGKPIGQEDLKRAYRTEGLAIFLGGLVNTFPHTGFSQNVGLVQLSGIKSRRPIYIAAVALMVVGFFPKIEAVAQIIPEPVLGGGMFVMFGMIAVAGIQMLSHVDFSNDRNFLLIAASVAIGLGFNTTPQLFQLLSPTLQFFLGNGIVMSSISAVVLNVLFNGIHPEEEKKEEV